MTHALIALTYLAQLLGVLGVLTGLYVCATAGPRR